MMNFQKFLKKLFMIPFPIIELAVAISFFTVAFFVNGSLKIALVILVLMVTIVYFLRLSLKLLKMSEQFSDLQHELHQVKISAEQFQAIRDQQSKNTDNLQQEQRQMRLLSEQLQVISDQQSKNTDNLQQEQRQMRLLSEQLQVIGDQQSKNTADLTDISEDLNKIRIGIREGLRTGTLPGNFHSSVSFDPEIDILDVLSVTANSRKAIDVGANRGEFTAALRRAGFMVDAFEPLPALIDELEMRFAKDKDVNIFPFACSDEDGEKQIYIASTSHTSFDESLLTTIDPHPTFEGLEFESSTKVQVHTLDTVLGSKKKYEVGLLKIDTEGHDLKVLNGANKIFAENIMVEYWDKDFVFNKNMVPNCLENYLKIIDRNIYPNYLVMWRGKNKKDYGILLNPEYTPSESWGNILFVSKQKTLESLQISLKEFLAH